MMPKTLALACIAIALSAWCAAANAPKIDFISTEEARRVMLDEAVSPFVSLMETHEMALFGAPASDDPIEQQRAAFAQQLAGGIEPFTDAEQQLVTRCAGKVAGWIGKKYPRLRDQPWKICKTTMRIPAHTRADCIVLPDGMVGRVLEAADTPDRFAAELHLARFLLHEQVHVVQRMVLNEKNWVGLYRKWGFEPVKSVPLDDPWVKTHKLTNPDGPDVNWLWRERTAGGGARIWWPLLLANTGGGSQLDYALVEVSEAGGVLTLKKDESGKPRYKTMRNNPALRRVMPTFSTPPYHPHEAAADLIDGLFAYDNRPQKSRESMHRDFLGQLAKDFEAYFQ